MDISAIIKNEVPAKWHTIEGSKVEVQIRTLKPKDKKRLRKSATHKRFTRGAGVDEKLDVDELSEAMMKEMVVDWKNIEMDGQEYKCTPEHIIELNDNWDAFSDLLTAVTVNERELEEAYKDEIEKNSEPGPTST